MINHLNIMMCALLKLLHLHQSISLHLTILPQLVFLHQSLQELQFISLLLTMPIQCIFLLMSYLMDGSSQALNNNSSSTTTANMRAPVLIQPSNISSTVHPINTIFSARSHGMHNNSSIRTADNPIVTQPSNNSSTGYPPEILFSLSHPCIIHIFIMLLRLVKVMHSCI